MSSLKLIWFGDLNDEKKPPNSMREISNEKYRPKLIELKNEQKEIKIGRVNSKFPPDYMIESCINCRMISRYHASIERLFYGGFMLYDHSMNGTYVNYTRVSGGVILKDGDIVCFGHINGANLKPGDHVAPFYSDLKYQVSLVGNLDSKESVDISKNSKRARKSSPSVSADSPIAGGAGNLVDRDEKPRVRSTSSGDKKLSGHKTSIKLDEDDDDEEDITNGCDQPKRSKVQLSSKKRINGERTSLSKRHGSSSNIPPSKKCVTPSSSRSSTITPQTKDRHCLAKSKRTTKQPSTGDGDLGSGDDLYHYDSEECSARPCKQPQDVAIDWIQCDKCSKWYHQVCLGIKAADANVEVYFCPYCK